jgi:Pyridoxamine 5'-phosphate oxidase
MPQMSDVIGVLDPRFSSPGATATNWKAARAELDRAMTYWLTTVRPDGRPHVTTIAGIWLDEAFHFTTGPGEQKARNLARGNTHVVVVTGNNGWDGMDVVLEGEGIRVTDADRLGRLAEAFTAKYDDFFRLRIVDGLLGWADAAEQAIEGRKDADLEGGPIAFEVRATKAFGFGKGNTFSQTRWRFAVPA